MNKILVSVLIVFVLGVSGVYSQTPLTLKLTGGANSPMGDFSDVYKSGTSIMGEIYYSLPFPGLDLTFSAGYNGFKYKNDYFTGQVTKNLGVGVDNLNYSWKATDVPVLIGARYLLPGGNLQPYISGEVGLHFMSFADRFNGQKLIGNTNNPTSFSYTGATESGSEIGVGTAIGAGVEIPFAPRISIDLNVKYNYAGITYSKAFTVFRNNNSQFTTSEMKNLNYLTARIGLQVSL